MKTCPKCGVTGQNLEQCSACQLVFAKYEEAELFKELLSEEKTKETLESEIPLQFLIKDSLRVQGGAPLIACLMGLICAKIPLLGFFFSYFMIWVHEFGHAFASWMAGIKATPFSFFSFGLTFHENLDRSVLVFSCFVFLMGVVAVYSYRERRPYIGIVASAVILFSVYCTWIASSHRVEFMIVAGGQGGEIILSALMISSFFFEFPDKWNWKYFARWPFLLLGFFCLISATLRWFEASGTRSLAGFGCNAEESAIAGVPGDLFRLLTDFGWTMDPMIRAYVNLCVLAWIWVIGHYVYFTIKALRQ